MNRWFCVAALGVGAAIAVACSLNPQPFPPPSTDLTPGTPMGGAGGDKSEPADASEFGGGVDAGSRDSADAAPPTVAADAGAGSGAPDAAIDAADASHDAGALPDAADAAPRDAEPE